MSNMFEVRSDAPTLTHALHPDTRASSRVVHTLPLSILPRAPRIRALSVWLGTGRGKL